MFRGLRAVGIILMASLKHKHKMTDAFKVSSRQESKYVSDRKAIKRRPRNSCIIIFIFAA